MSEFVGKIGERRDFNLTFINQFMIQTKPWMFVDICEDENGNRIVYRGFGHAISGSLFRGKKFRVRATIMEHREFEGVKETLIIRPRIFDQEGK